MSDPIPHRGSRLEALRKALGVSQEFIADLSGVLRHQDVSLAESGKTKFTSDRLWQGLLQAFGMQRKHLQGYLDGQMPLEQAAALARPKIKRAMAERERLAVYDELAQKAFEEAELTGDMFADAVLHALQEMARQLGPKRKLSVADLVKAARALRLSIAVAFESIAADDVSQNDSGTFPSDSQ